MDETKAMLGILLIAVVATTGFIAFSEGSTGAATQSYVACCCNILVQSNEPQYLIRTQVQTFAEDCNRACVRYADEGKVFGQEGLCQDDI